MKVYFATKGKKQVALLRFKGKLIKGEGKNRPLALKKLVSVAYGSI